MQIPYTDARAFFKRLHKRYAAAPIAFAPALLLLAPRAGFSSTIGQLSFWATVVLATAGSALSAFCVAYPISEPKRDPCSYIGQWFVWSLTPLLWGIVAASLAVSALRPWDLPAVVVAIGIGRWSSQAVCNFAWRKHARTQPELGISRRVRAS